MKIIKYLNYEIEKTKNSPYTIDYTYMVYNPSTNMLYRTTPFTNLNDAKRFIRQLVGAKKIVTGMLPVND